MNNNITIASKKPPSTRKRKMSEMMDEVEEALDAFDAMSSAKAS